MKIILTLLAILTLSTLTYSQTIVEWKEDELITLQSFEGELPDLAEDQIQQYTFAATFDFNFQMLNMQFAFTKNFNQYVKAYYVPSLSWIEKGELNDQLLVNQEIKEMAEFCKTCKPKKKKK